MEVVVRFQDFHFDSTSSTPYVSAPSSPKRFGDPFDLYCHYTSAPSSPTRAAAIYAHFNTMSANNSLRLSSTSPPSAIPFDWEEKPGTPKARSTAAADTDHDFDFAFDFSGQLDEAGMPPALTAADELFEEGKIRPLKPPPRLQYPVMDDRSSVTASSLRSPRSPKSKGLWSPRHRGRGGKGEEFDPFTAAMVEATRERGRERAPTSLAIPSSRSRKGSRSLSPLRGGGGGGGGGGGFFQKPLNSPPPTAATSSTNTPKSGGSKKWRLRDLLLFRSASEGRATGNRSKDPLRKYILLSTSNSSSISSPVSKKKVLSREEDLRNSSFRSVDSNGSTRRGNQSGVSAHETHYTVNRAATEEMKKKTPLPYRQNLFSCLRFNPAVNRIARGFGSSFTHRRS
ncbi:uncharacterized protein LOC103711986 [Phoenix dactylifera]|uniref:Uncharacterized protein LOC103711986 n=1 Tax=Phoenix dactylifera TaxID=42345 RepID=A0A8B7MUZ9_PHODC|nr:uncharacterized protein LOC103711986 [Phoenix dactylifera]